MIDESGKSVDIQPDYTKPTAEVYEQLILQWIRTRWTLELLDACNLDGRQPGMPTWVPNWDAQANNLQSYDFASGYSACRTTYIERGILEVGGVQVATVKDAHFAKLQTNSLESIVSIVREFAPNYLEANYLSGGTVFDGYCRALCYDRFATKYLPPREGCPYLELSQKTLRECLDPSKDLASLDFKEVRYFECAWHLRDHPFITTQEGYLGYGTSPAKPGDKVCVLLGFDKLMLLRPTENENYEVVGPAYLYGQMSCEGLLGPLPVPFKKVWIYAPQTQGYYNGYVHRETGHFQSEDPRKPPLPSGWKKNQHTGDKYIDWYINEETGEDSGFFDPRLTFESLVDTGVKMEIFALI